MKCRICDNSKDNTLYEAREMQFGFRDKFTYFQCANCGCLQIFDISANISRYYPANYYSFNMPLWAPKKDNILVRTIRKIRNDYAITKKGFLGRWIYSKYPARGLKTELHLYFPNPPANLYSKDSKILDVGCGNGRFLHLLKEVGFKNLLGIDPYGKRDIIYPNGLKILKKSIHDINGEFDLIVFQHSFEHMPDPLETLQSVSRLLSQNGFCVIHIPIVDSYAWREYRQDWVGLDAPRHFFLHSIKSMRILSDKAGLDIKKIVYDSNEMQFWGSEQYRSDIPLESEESYCKNKHKSIFSERQIDSFKKRAEELNRKNEGDCAAFYFKKNSYNLR